MNEFGWSNRYILFSLPFNTVAYLLPIYIRWIMIMIEIALNDVIPARYIEVCFAIFVTTTPIRFSRRECSTFSKLCTVYNH
jgi:hypothetical protein